LAAKEHWPPFGSHLVFLLQLSFPVIFAAAPPPPQLNTRRKIIFNARCACESMFYHFALFCFSRSHSVEIIAHYL
jgi:hypothetical protein